MYKYLQLLVLLVTACAQLFGQRNDISERDQVTATVHKGNIGKIVFTANDVSSDPYTEKDYLLSYRFTPKSDLYITAYLEHSLTYNLRKLAPGLPTDELIKTGSYNFSFYVDGKLIYQDNLHPASLFPEQKNNDTIIRKPLTAHPFRNLWSAYLWFRFLKNGGDSALTEGKHRLGMEIRPYLANPGLIVGDVVAAGEVLLDVQHPKIDPSSLFLGAVAPYDGLQVAKETFDSAKIKELKAREAEDVFKDITSIVVLKNGKILIEEYFNKADRNTLHDVRSVGKTFASTITGMAIRDGYLKNEYQTLKEFYNLRNFANYAPEKEHTTIKELLTMSSIFEGNDNKGNSVGNEENMYPTPDWVKFTLDLPADTAYADGRWHYFTAGVVLLGDILHKSVPGGLEAYAHGKLFTPLGITNYKWQYTPQKVANTAGGLRMNALDFAKYAQLYKNGGMWNGKQILPKQWVDKSFTKVKSLPGRENEFYGYLFWNKTYKVKGKEYETFYCAGNGGNHIYIFKELPLVVVVTGAAYNRPYAHSQVHTIMQDYVLPAVAGLK
ncbi:MAG TPA: serine hydrolase [Chitinophagaceae bacterium]|nr:serine hydrolase [Chitinophagaceae bacterium]